MPFVHVLEFQLPRNHLNNPNVADLVGIIKDKGPRCMLFKKDLKRAYRQIPVCPGDIHFIGFSWENCLFVDRVLPMALEI
jgi:hypothetical protein